MLVLVCIQGPLQRVCVISGTVSSRRAGSTTACVSDYSTSVHHTDRV